jgi:hypothetical protein
MLSVILLLLLILTTALRDGFVLLGFKINQQYIAKNLCIERNYEGSLCHGSCQLKLRLSENHEQSKNAVTMLLNDLFPVQFFFKPTDPTNPPIITGEMLAPGIKQVLYFSEYLFKLFHPPK